MAFDFDNLEEQNPDKNIQRPALENAQYTYTDTMEIWKGDDPHAFLKSKGCFSAKKGFYLNDSHTGYSGEYYIGDPKDYLEYEEIVGNKTVSKPIPEVANFSTLIFEVPRRDLSKPVETNKITDENLEYPFLVFQQLSGEIRPDGVFPSNDSKLNKLCHIFLGIFKVEKVEDGSASNKYKYRFTKIGDTFYFDPSKKS